MQQGDDELKTLLSATNQTLQQQLRMRGQLPKYIVIFPRVQYALTCLMLPTELFLQDNLSHPNCAMRKNLKRFVWTSLNKDIRVGPSCIPPRELKLTAYK
ncbi:hypothetical protein TNIN_414261 [Trichonephila inaurata madagascariensis]|uniref:Uncharacterized protein n=1 Tax=Trichonephila inaurata madagascariensis TaxID=2747483 RepID=A0A8X7CBX5_9ARAC|nr:hypothetical protein TNIN_414261 [Trichonephila inaurata madagascariensis]